MKRRKSLKKDNWGYVFIAPFFLVFLVFNLYSIIYTLQVSFTSWDGINNPISIGLKNYSQLLKDTMFWGAVGNTMLITLTAGFLQLITALVLAYVLSQKFIKFPNVFKNIFYFPNLVTAISLGVLFSLLFAWHGGSINQLFMALHLIKEPVNWMVNGGFVKGLIIFIIWFQYFGYYIIIFTAGMKGISNDILEAAAIDGAGKLNVFFSIVIPVLRPVITYAAITIIIGGMQLFDMPYIIGKGVGAPNGASLTAISYMYTTSFKNGNYGYGAAISYGLFVIIIVFSVFYMKQYLKQEGGEQ